ncbi:putative kinetochore protein SPC25 [Pichia kudriavzevii]|uniref:Kinetochore protein SPC25 n=1 Tax=Pichia kudriavzevii TaxID=4909 RepID=A0A1V2LME7_PICKU|nr:putative kinetochore protein SPC25 [Pichia kudriavzevii]
MSGDTIPNTELQLRENIHVLQGLQPEMQDLKNTVAEYIENVQNAILKRRADYQRTLSHLKSTETKLKSEIKMNKSLRDQLIQDLSNEMRRRDELSVKYEEMRVQQENLELQELQYSKQLADVENKIAVKLREVNEQRNKAKNQTTLVNDKLFQFEQLLGLSIENCLTENTNSGDEGEDANTETEQIKFTFRNVDPNDFSREVFFVFDPLKAEIVFSNPELQPEVLKKGTQIFTETKEIGFMWNESPSKNSEQSSSTSKHELVDSVVDQTTKRVKIESSVQPEPNSSLSPVPEALTSSSRSEVLAQMGQLNRSESRSSLDSTRDEAAESSNKHVAVESSNNTQRIPKTEMIKQSGKKVEDIIDGSDLRKFINRSLTPYLVEGLDNIVQLWESGELEVTSSEDAKKVVLKFAEILQNLAEK